MTRLASVNEVARFFDVDVDTVEALITDGELRTVRVGSQRRIPTSDAIAYVNRQLSTTDDRAAARTREAS